MNKSIRIATEVNINPANIIGHFSEEDAIEFICALDLYFANMDFTDKVLERLALSVKDDCSAEEWNHYEKFANFLKK